MSEAPVVYRLGITGTGRLLHVLGAQAGVALCGRKGMCTAGGYGTVAQPAPGTPRCRRCFDLHAQATAPPLPGIAESAGQ